MFIALPVGMNYRTERFPVVTISLIGLNTLVYLVSLFFFFKTYGDSNLWIHKNLWLIPAQSYFWTYLTSMFVHAGIFHLAGNMIFLFLFGSCVEDLIGRIYFTIFYLVGGLVAELVYIAMLPAHFSSPNPMGGASGAISACMGMYLLLRAGADIEFKYFLWLFVIRAGEFEIPAWVAISFWFFKDLLWAVIGMMSKGPSHGGVAFGAHVGGLLGGLGLVSLYKWVLAKKEADETEISLPIYVPQPVRAAAYNRASSTASETPTIYLFDGAAQTGPFTLTQIQRGLMSGEISREMQYWSEGMTAWQSVVELSSQPLE